MLTTSRGLLVAGISVCILAAGLVDARPAAAQFTRAYVPEKISRLEAANLFAGWSQGRSVDGFVVELPPDWSLESAALLKNAYRPVDLNVEELDDSRYRIGVDGGVATSAELVLRVRGGDASGSENVFVTPFVEDPDSGVPLLLDADRLTLSLRIESTFTDPLNRVLSFAAPEAQPLVFRSDALPPIERQHAHLLSFWLKTTGLNEIVFSTWDGDQHRPYPLEIIVDPAGRLRTYRGQPGEHQSIASKEPIADGSWHHVEVTNEPEAGWMRLIVDGRTVDSLLTSTSFPTAAWRFAALGGRLPAENAYFDGTSPYAGLLDELRIESRSAQAATSARREPARSEPLLRLTFDERIPADLLREPPRGVRFTRSDLSFHRPVEAFRASSERGVVVLQWRAQDEQALEFVVERSRDGSTFESIERVPANQGESNYEFREPAEGERVVYYRLRQVFPAGAERISGTIKVGMGAEQPESVTLVGNFPNPFNNATTMSYSVTEPSHVELSVWDLSGQPVRRLVDRMHDAGYYEIQFDAGDLPSGTYFMRLEAPSGIKSHKMILMR